MRGLVRAVSCAGALLAALDRTAAAADRTVYRYVDHRGTVVFVQGRDQVPARYRDRARPVDLGRADPNAALARDLRDQARAQPPPAPPAARLDCAAPTDRLELPPWLTQHPRLAVAAALGAAIALALLLAALVRHTSLALWAKVITTALPTAVLVACIWAGAVRLRQYLPAARGAQARCGAPSPASPGAALRGAHEAHVERLDRSLQQLER
jgi:hypothetical protein